MLVVKGSGSVSGNRSAVVVVMVVAAVVVVLLVLVVAVVLVVVIVVVVVVAVVVVMVVVVSTVQPVSSWHLYRATINSQVKKRAAFNVNIVQEVLDSVVVQLPIRCSD